MSVISPADTHVESTDATPPRKSSLVRKLGSGVAFLMLLIAAFFALVMVVVPMATGSQTYTVLTSSMAPKYAPGAFLAVKPTAFSDLRVGDVITYQIESGKPDVITHRITAIGANQQGARILTTKGDNNSLPDALPVQEVQIKGKLLYAVPYLGYVAHTVGQDRDLLLPVIAMALIAFGGFSMVKGAQEKKRARSEARRSE